jgi:hypothetical protein
VLEGHFELIVANAHHIRTVPGRKTDVKDAEWLADLIRHGLVKPSFVPPPIRDLRDLVRLRRSLSEALTTEQNRTLKLLETANIKLASVVSEVFGVSGRAMMKALVENTATPQEMADLALDGRLSEHHRYLPPPAGRGNRGGSAHAGRAHRGEGSALRGAAAPAPADPRRRRPDRVSDPCGDRHRHHCLRQRQAA